jgi:hypothetical protein
VGTLIGQPVRPCATIDAAARYHADAPPPTPPRPARRIPQRCVPRLAFQWRRRPTPTRFLESGWCRPTGRTIDGRPRSRSHAAALLRARFASGFRYVQLHRHLLGHDRLCSRRFLAVALRKELVPPLPLSERSRNSSAEHFDDLSAVDSNCTDATRRSQPL